jgi:hypothetical protein
MYRIVFACLLLLTVRAGNTQTPDDMMRQFQELFREMERQMNAMPRTGMPFGFEADSSSFHFRIDTSFTFPEGGGFNLFFSQPFGEMPNSDFFDNDEFFKNFFRIIPPDTAQDFPSDDGNSPRELLPEERLRLEEEHGSAPKPSTPKQQKPARSTIRL